MADDDEQPPETPVDERVNAAVCAEAVGDGSVVTGWVLAYTYMDADGSDRVGVLRMPGLTLTGELGLLDYALIAARTSVQRNTLGLG